MTIVASKASSSAAFLVGVAVLTALALGAAVALSPKAPEYATVAIFAGLLFWFVAVRSSLVIASGILLFLPALLLPADAGVLAGALFAMYILWRAATFPGRQGAFALACLGILGLWLALGINSNIPNLHVALLGTRKTTVVFLGLGVGAVWPRESRKRAEPMIMLLLVGVALICLAIHLGDPALEQSFARKASVYTDLFAGKLRMEGIFAGPFHVALLGAFFGIRGWHVAMRRRWLEAAGLEILGFVLILEADVRTAFLTVGAGVILTLLLKPPGAVQRRAVVFRTGLLGLLIVLVLATGALGQNAALQSLPSLSTNDRAVNRLVSWSTALAYFEQSPLYGQGPGSAGSTLGLAGVGIRQHVTSDNEFLGVLTEGGVIGVLAIGTVFWLIWRWGDGVMDTAHPSSAAVLALFGFAFTGNVFETVPVCVMLSILIGLRVAAPTGAVDDEIHAERGRYRSGQSHRGPRENLPTRGEFAAALHKNDLAVSSLPLERHIHG